MNFFVNTFLTFLIILLKTHCKKMGDVHIQPRLLGLYIAFLCIVTTPAILLPFYGIYLLVIIIYIYLHFFFASNLQCSKNTYFTGFAAVFPYIRQQKYSRYTFLFDITAGYLLSIFNY